MPAGHFRESLIPFGTASWRAMQRTVCWQRLRAKEDIFAAGTELRAEIISVNRQRQIDYSFRLLKFTLWGRAENRRFNCSSAGFYRQMSVHLQPTEGHKMNSDHVCCREIGLHESKQGKQAHADTERPRP
jgi:hypothetical protein